MPRFMTCFWWVLRQTYGCPPHPAIYRDASGAWRCTECHNLV